jgi:hydroxymethylbilane synthase
MKLRIGTRGSDLALWQARHVASRLAGAAEVEIIVLKTRGDAIDDIPLTSVEGKGFFTGEIERALLANEIDLAVHSHKDLPTESTPGLAIAAVPERANATERLLIRPQAHVPRSAFLPVAVGALVGTSSPRREQQLRALRPDLRVASLRGNVPTRVRRLREGRFDAIVLASAGLERLELDLSGLEQLELNPAWFVPAPAQGALAIQIRATDTALAALLRERLHDPATARAIAIERICLARAGGGCNLPFGAFVSGTGPFAAHLFLGAGHPTADSSARWASATADTPEKAADEAFARLALEEKSGANTRRSGPLAGLRVALTGSAADGSTLGARLSMLGATLVHERVIEFEDIEAPDLARRLAGLRNGDAVAVTSREAARRLAGAPQPAGVCVGAVGTATARALELAGWRASVIGSAGARELARALPVGSGARVLFPCAEAALEVLEIELARRGVGVDRVPLYRTRRVVGVRLDPHAHVRVYLSPSAAHEAAALERTAQDSLHEPPSIVRFALGDTTLEALRSAGVDARSTSNRSAPPGEELAWALAHLVETREISL